MAWVDLVPPRTIDHPILKGSNKNLVFLVTASGTTGPEAFMEKTLLGNNIGLKVVVPSNIKLTDLGFGMGILVTSQPIPAKVITVMSREDIEEVFV